MDKILFTSLSKGLSSDNQLSHLTGLFLLSALWLILIGIGLRDPWPADEPRFAQVAKEMVESGQWLFPMRGGELYPDKPPVFMWAIAACYWLFGSLKLAFLLPNALSSLATLYLIVDLGKRLWSKKIGLTAGFLLLFTVQFTLQAKTAQIDAMVCFFITLGCYSMLRFLLLGGHWRWYYLSFFAMGIGVITKGVGFLPILMLIPFAAARAMKITPAITQGDIKSVLLWFLGIGAFLGAVCLWLLPMLWQVHVSQDADFTQYRDNILFRQTVTRYADSWHHIKPFWYYIASVIPTFWLPLSLAVPWLVPHWITAFKQRDMRIILPAVWIVLLLFFFSVSPGKRGVYILPAVPILALIAAPFISTILTNKPIFNRILWCIVTAIGGTLTVVGIAGLFDFSFTHKWAQKLDIAPWTLFTTLGLVILFGAFWRIKTRPWQSWILFFVAFWSLYSTWGSYLMNDVRTPKSVYSTLKTKVPTVSTLGLVDFSEQFLLFTPYPTIHFGYHTRHDDQIREAYRFISEGENRYILVDKQAISSDCFDINKAINLGHAHRRDWVVLGKNSTLAECAAPSEPVRRYHYTPALQ